MKLTVLGYMGGYPYNGHGTSSYLLQQDGYNLLIDCGSGAVNELAAVVDPLQLDAVILSHYHHDHIADVGVLQYYWQLNQGNKKHDLLQIYGNTQDPINYSMLSMDGVSEGKSYVEGEPLKLGPFTIVFLKTVHPVPTYAMRITDGHSVLGFTADTDFFEGLVPFFDKCDVLVTDTNFDSTKTAPKWHMTSEESGNLARKTGSETLILSHLPQQLDLDKIYEEAKLLKGDSNVKLATEKLEINF